MALPEDTEILPPIGDGPRLPALGAPELSVEFLSKLKEIVEVMLGRRGGSQWSRAVTFRDLANSGSNSQAQSIMAGSVAGMLEAELRKSAAFKELTRRIGGAEDLATYPEEIRQQLSLSLDTIARARQADIQSTDRKIQNSVVSMSSRITELTASLNEVAAGVRHFDAAYADRATALAVSLTQVTARLDGAGGPGVTVEEKLLAQADMLTGLLGQWSIKIQAGSEADPVMAGISLSLEDPVAGPATSSLIFMTDKFGMVTPSGKVFPFSADAFGLNINGLLRVNGVALEDIASGDPVPGPAGPRGNVDIGVVTTGTVWSDSEAVAGLSAAGYGAPIQRDVVTLYKTDRTFAKTKVYISTSWVDVAGIIDGNLLVKDSVLAEHIVTDGMIINDGAGNPIIGLGVPLAEGYEAPNTKNSDFGSGVNIIPANSLPSSPTGFSAAASSGVPSWTGPTFVPPSSGAAIYSPGGAGCVFTYASGTPTTGSVIEIYKDISAWYPVTAGRRYEFSVAASAHRCNVQMVVRWYDAGGVALGNAVGSLIAATAATTSTHPAADDFPQSILFATAPVGAVAAFLYAQQIHTGAAEPYAFYARWYAGEAGSTQTVASKWGPSPAEVAADAKAKADAAQAAAATDATSKANAAQAAAIAAAATAAQAKADLAETTAKAYADGIVTDEEARAIADATAKANAAQAAAIAAAAADATAKANAVADAANAALADKLSKTAASILSAPITISTSGGISVGSLAWDSAGNRSGGYGVAATPKGFVGYNSDGTLTFFIDATTGVPYFYGASIVNPTLDSYAVGSQVDEPDIVCTNTNTIRVIKYGTATGGKAPYRFVWSWQRGQYTTLSPRFSFNSTGGNTDNECEIRCAAPSTGQQGDGIATLTCIDANGRSSSTNFYIHLFS